MDKIINTVSDKIHITRFTYFCIGEATVMIIIIAGLIASYNI